MKRALTILSCFALFLQLRWTEGGFVYLSIRGSECFADIDLSNQMSLSPPPLTATQTWTLLDLD